MDGKECALRRGDDSSRKAWLAMVITIHIEQHT